MDRLEDRDRMNKIEELEVRLRTSQKREEQLKQSLLFWRGNSVGVVLLIIGLYFVHVLLIQTVKSVNDIVKESVEKERDKIADCVIPESEAVYGNYLKCFPWMFEEEKSK